MVKRHMKRISSPRSWPIKRKRTVFVTRPAPGAHPYNLGLPINLVFKEILNIAKTTKEVKNIMHNQKILIDGKDKKDYRALIGLMDILSLPALNKHYQVLLNNKGKLVFKEISDKESKLKTCKITGKTLLKGNKMQLNLHDGKNQIVDKIDYNRGDSIILEIPGNMVKDHLKLEKGAFVFLIGGKHVGEHGVIQSIDGNTVTFKSDKNETFETLKKYLFVLKK